MEIVLYRRRTSDVTVTVYSPSSEVVVFTPTDVFRLKIGRSGEAPILDLDSDAPSANASTVQDANPSNVRITADDLALLSPGTYDMEAAIYEGDDGRLRAATPGVMHIVETMLGEGEP